MSNGPERVSDVLAMVAREPGGLSAMELAEVLTMSRAAVYRLLNLMVDSCLLEREPGSEKYTIAPQLYATTSTALRRIPLLEASLLPMADGVRSSGHTLILGINRGIETIFLRRVERVLDYVLVSPTGSRVPAHVTATGKVILANEPEDIRRRIVAQATARPTAATLVGRELMTELEQVQRCGFALNYGVHQPDARGIAVAIFDSRRRPVGAVGTSVPEDGDENNVLPVLREVCGSISRTLGYVSDEALILP